MRIPLLTTGLWVRFIVIPILIPLGILELTHWGCLVLYRAKAGVRPLWTAILLHVAVVLIILLLLGWMGYIYWERVIGS